MDRCPIVYWWADFWLLQSNLTQSGFLAVTFRQGAAATPKSTDQQGFVWASWAAEYRARPAYLARHGWLQRGQVDAFQQALSVALPCWCGVKECSGSRGARQCQFSYAPHFPTRVKALTSGLQRQEKELLNQNPADKKESAGWKGALEAWSCIERWKVRVAANLKHKACWFLLLRDAFFSVAITWTEVGLQLGSRLSPSVAGLGRNRGLAPVLASPSAPSASIRHSTPSE